MKILRVENDYNNKTRRKERRKQKREKDRGKTWKGEKEPKHEIRMSMSRVRRYKCMFAVDGKGNSVPAKVQHLVCLSHNQHATLPGHSNYPWNPSPDCAVTLHLHQITNNSEA